MKRFLSKSLLPLLASSMLVLALYHVVRAYQTLPQPSLDFWC